MRTGQPIIGLEEKGNMARWKRDVGDHHEDAIKR